MPVINDLLNLVQRWQAPVAWTNSPRDVIDHFLDRGKFVHRLSVHSNVDRMEPSEIEEHFRALGDRISGLQGVPVYLASKYFTKDGSVDAQKKVFQVGENYLEAELISPSFHPRTIQVDIIGERSEEVEHILEALKPWVREAPPIETTSSVYTLVTDQEGYSLRSLGKTKINFEPSNYAPEAVERYQHLTECLTSDDPCGRFCLFDGPPGTGKSYLIRALINTLDAVFVLIPTAMIGSLSGPALLPTFTNLRANKKPIILVLEDADMALVSRKVNRGNPAALAEILNLGDGLVGEMLDLRIIATTNAERMDLDPAITRPGRMCTHLTLGELSAPHLADIYDRLAESNQGTDVVQKAHAKTLAEVYRLARDTTWAAKAPADEGAGTYL